MILPQTKFWQGSFDPNGYFAKDVGRDTVLRAIDILRSEGLVFTVPRRGT